MRFNGVVLLGPSLYHHLGLPERIEYLSVKQFISQLAVKISVMTIFPGTAEFNGEDLGTHVGQTTDAPS
jgi:hypothetical protein